MRFAASCLAVFVTLAIAQPHKHVHQHKAQHIEARNQPAIKWVTEYEYTTEVIPITTTIWVSPGFVPPPETKSTSSPSHRNTVPAQFFQPVSEQSSSPSSSTPSTTSTYVAPAPVTTSVQPTTVETKSSTTPAPISSVSQAAPAPVDVAPVEASSSPAPAPAPAVSSTPSSDASSGSSGGECSKATPCDGDITHYDANVGIGACGWTSDGKSENVVALSHILMGTQSNGNPFCGKTITVKLNGKSIVAKVVDKCMGCERHAIDLSEHAFSELEDMGVGRTQVEWFFN